MKSLLKKKQIKKMQKEGFLGRGLVALLLMGTYTPHSADDLHKHAYWDTSRAQHRKCGLCSLVGLLWRILLKKDSKLSILPIKKKNNAKKLSQKESQFLGDPILMSCLMKNGLGLK